MTEKDKSQIAMVFGVGAEKGLGAALVRKFAAEGMRVCAVGRSSERLAALAASATELPGVVDPVVADVTQEEDVLSTFARYGAGEIALVVYNAGNNARIPMSDLTASQFEDFWRVGCYGGFLVGKAAAGAMKANGRGTILFTGASASLRGRPDFAHFAAAKAGLRMLGQSMARELGPLGIHVGHVVIDGGINGERLQSRFGGDAAFQERAAHDGLLNIDALAQAYWSLHCQHRSAWTHELDLRPFIEPF